MPRGNSPDETRRKILSAAFDEFFQNGFQGGSLNHIIEAAGTTKGAVFHHFNSKLELGYMVLQEIIEPLMHKRWTTPLAGSSNPIADLKQLFRQHIKEDIAGGVTRGCPLNNLAQEMSPLDEGFRSRINAAYELWREAISSALIRGIRAGRVKKEASPRHAAALIVAAQMGIWGTAKSSQNAALMMQAGEALCGYLDSMKAS